MFVVLRVAYKISSIRRMGQGVLPFRVLPLLVLSLSQEGTVTELQEMKTSKFPSSFTKLGFHRMGAIAGFISNQVILHRRYITCSVSVSIILNCPFSLFAVN